jgi:hypothetical protein
LKNMEAELKSTLSAAKASGTASDTTSRRRSVGNLGKLAGGISKVAGLRSCRLLPPAQRQAAIVCPPPQTRRAGLVAPNRFVLELATTRSDGSRVPSLLQRVQNDLLARGYAPDGGGPDTTFTDTILARVRIALFDEFVDADRPARAAYDFASALGTTGAVCGGIRRDGALEDQRRGNINRWVRSCRG